MLRRRIRVDNPDLLAEGFESEGEGELRADRVTVRPRM
jgi:hypothetical protein